MSPVTRARFVAPLVAFAAFEVVELLAVPAFVVPVFVPWLVFALFFAPVVRTAVPVARATSSG
jgi:hypothetical protein